MARPWPVARAPPADARAPSLRFEPGTPNHERHFCAGDLARWSGIKRCGAAMHGGHYVAQNIHKSVLRDRVGEEPSFAELQEVPPMIGLAVGSKGVASGPEGTVAGEDVLQSYFGDDLGFTSKSARFAPLPGPPLTRA